MEPQVITVSQFLAIINETLGFAYPQVVIEGEVSSFKVNQGKFVFFDLKDDTNVLSCFMMIHQLKLPLEDGMQVRVTGTPKVTKFSKFSLTVREVEIAGEGQLRRAMELLKRKLEAEGLFDSARKRPLPVFPRRIGLITSATSAAYADFMKILSARWGGLEVQLADVTVQGQTAPDQITNAISYFNLLRDPVDVLVIIRGGGSLEDLMAFSTEPVARAVAASRTPTIVGVGHEVDISLADYAADLRAATPTDAARLVVPDRREILARVNRLTETIGHSLTSRITTSRNRITQSIHNLERALAAPKQRVEELRAQLLRGLDNLRARARILSSRVETAHAGLGAFSRLVVAEKRTHIQHLEQLLAGYNPTAVLGRGYAIVRHQGKILKSSHTLQTGDPLMIQLAQDQLEAEVHNS